MKVGTQGKAGLVRELVHLFPNIEWTQALVRNFPSQTFADRHFYEICTRINFIFAFFSIYKLTKL